MYKKYHYSDKHITEKSFKEDKSTFDFHIFYKYTEKEILSNPETSFLAQSFAKDVNDPEEISRIEFEDDMLFMIIRVPFYDSKDQENIYKTIPLGIAYDNQNTVYILSSRKTKLIDNLLALKQIDETQVFGYVVIRLLNLVIKKYISFLKEISKKAEEIEEDLKRTLNNKELVRLFVLEKNLIRLKTSLRNNYRTLKNFSLPT